MQDDAKNLTLEDMSTADDFDLVREFSAKAMLMEDGVIYNSPGHYFVNLQHSADARNRLDADTMEPITEKEAEARRELEHGYYARKRVFNARRTQSPGYAHGYDLPP